MAQEHINHDVRPFRKLTRQAWQLNKQAEWRQVRAVQGDVMAFRAYMLDKHGPQSLVNAIMGAHGLPNRF